MKTTTKNQNATSNNEKTFLATEILKNVDANEIQSILKMKNNEVLTFKEDGTIYFKYRLIVDTDGVKQKEIYDDIIIKIDDKLKYHFCLYGIKQKFKDCIAIEKQKIIKDKNGNEKKTYNNYSETQLKEIAKSRLEKHAAAFEQGIWKLTSEKTSAIVENAKNKTIYYTILNLRFNNIDKKTALMLNKNNESYVNEIYDFNTTDFSNKCKEFNIN